MNTLLTWYRHTAWLGIVLNLSLLLQNGSPTDKQVNGQSVENDLLVINSEVKNKLTERQIDYRLPTCTFCHTGTFKGRNLNNNRPKALTYSPTHAPDLEASRWSSYNCTASKRTDSDTLARFIDRFTDGSSTGRMIYKHLTLPFAKTALPRQEQAYAWQNNRPH